MATRKTIVVDDVVEIVNEMLAASTCSPETRRGMIAVLHEVLHRTDNYDGFRYLSKFDLPDDVLPGIVWEGEGENRTSSYPDDTRRQYGCKHVRLDANRRARKAEREREALARRI